MTSSSPDIESRPAWNEANPEWWQAQVEYRMAQGDDIAWAWLANSYDHLTKVEEAARAVVDQYLAGHRLSEPVVRRLIRALGEPNA